MLARVIASIRSGEHFSDKLAIAFTAARAGLFPLALLRRFGIVLPDPARMIGAYTCQIDGLRIKCPGGGGPYFLFCHPSHDPGVRAAIDAVDSGTFIDVGAHVGFFALQAARRLSGRGRVVAIEPHPVRFSFLEENRIRNGLHNLTPLPYALGDHNGVATLFDLDPALGAHERDVSLAPSRGPSVQVPLRTLDSVTDELNLNDVALIKVDVEGFEPQVLAGARRLLLEQSPKVVFEALAPQSLAESSRLLNQLGYEVRQVDETNYLAERVTRP